MIRRRLLIKLGTKAATIGVWWLLQTRLGTIQWNITMVKQVPILPVIFFLYVVASDKNPMDRHLTDF